MNRYYGDKDSMIVEYPVEILYGQDIVWMDGVGYSKLPFAPYYVVTTEGDVISFRKSVPRYLSQTKTNNGHLYVDIEGERYLVHRLIAMAFLTNNNNYPIVRHLDDNPENNALSNLAWGTYKDNTADCIRNDHDYKRPVYCVETDTTYRTGAEAAKEFGVSKSSIVHYCKGIVAPKNGYHFCYDEDKEWKLKDEEWLKPFNNHGYKAVIAISPDGKETYYESRKEAAEYLRIPACGISSVINGHAEHTHGWRFREVNL